MDDKRQTAIFQGIVIGTMLGVITGIIIGVTVGQLGVGMSSVIGFVIAYSAGISVWNLKRIK
tara:strand:- start:645 stop:830 length:186 start_codon:yes stop_codon:yes gene_type:complete